MYFSHRGKSIINKLNYQFSFFKIDSVVCSGYLNDPKANMTINFQSSTCTVEQNLHIPFMRINI